MSEQLLKVRELKKYFKTGKGMLHAVDGIDLDMTKGRTLGVVGESGCGKSTLGKTVLRLYDVTEGHIFFKGEDISRYKKRKLDSVRREMQMIFQDPYSSLNPRMNVGELIAEPIIINHMENSKNLVQQRVKELMDTVGLAQRISNSYPHELDGGRRQRIGVARALSVEPELIICDEPVSALDVSIQAQILNLLMDIQDEHGIAYMFITHDLSVVKHISDEIIVLYMGKCVERAETRELFKNPLHPYTKALLNAIPAPNLKRRNKEIEVIIGEVNSPINPHLGCRFAARCSLACDSCKEEITLKKVNSNHYVACAMLK